MNMNLIDRYVYDVGRRLPQKQREDIEKELKSLLMDAIEARAGGLQPTEEDTVAVLKEFGHPTKVAARYTGEQYLISPRLFSTYRMVLGIVLAATAFGLCISFIVGSVGQSAPVSLASTIAGWISSLISSALCAFGSVTLIFWGIERGLDRTGKEPDMLNKWDPRALPPVPKPTSSWKPGESKAAIVFTIIALVLLNAFPGNGILLVFHGVQWPLTAILSPDAMRAYIPWWDIGLALSLALHLTLLLQKRWNLATNVFHIVLQVYNAAVIAMMMRGPALLNTSGAFWTSTQTTQVPAILNMQFHWIFIVALIGCAVGAIQGFVRIFREKA